MNYKIESVEGFMGISDWSMMDQLRAGEYSDQYFLNTANTLKFYEENGGEPIEVEAQIFSRPKNSTVVGGIGVCLDLLRQMVGHEEREYRGYGNSAYPTPYFESSYQKLEVEAVPDGSIVSYNGNPKEVMPVMKIRGVYRDFATVETPILGILAHISRVATNVYNVLVAAQGKPIMFYPARFDLPETQYYDGLAYKIAIDRYNLDYPEFYQTPIVSTDMQALSFEGVASGTNPHSLIAAFNGNIVEAMHQYAMALPLNVKRVALVDFHNDCAYDSIAVASYYFERYIEAYEANDEDGMKRWTLFGVRLDTSGNHVDRGLLVAGYHDVPENRGVTMDLVSFVRHEIDAYANREYFNTKYSQLAWEYFSAIKIIVTGGFNAKKIAAFVKNDIPVDIFGVGSSLLKNDDETNADFTMDVVRIKKDGEWIDVAKVGRAACSNPDLKPITLD